MMLTSTSTKLNNMNPEDFGITDLDIWDMDEYPEVRDWEDWPIYDDEYPDWEDSHVEED